MGHPALTGRSRNSKFRRGRTRNSIGASDTFLAPYDLDVVPWASWSASSGTPSRTANTNYLGLGVETNSSPANGDYVQWSFFVEAGTYALTWIHPTFSSYGIVDLTIDGGAAVGTVDCYAAGITYNAVTQITGLVLAQGVHSVRVAVNGKNASSSGYSMTHVLFTFTRTGA